MSVAVRSGEGGHAEGKDAPHGRGPRERQNASSVASIAGTGAIEPCRVAVRRRDRSIVAWALVDEQDYALLAAFNWHLTKGYVRRQDGRHLTLMHRQVMGLGRDDPFEVDHINRDKLDNRRANLRVVTRMEHGQNNPAWADAASPFRGVTRSSNGRRWRGRLWIQGTGYACGTFDTDVEAALAIDQMRIEMLPFATPDPELSKRIGGQS